MPIAPARVSPCEKQFWERISFSEFGILMVRLQALIVLFPVVIELTYLPGYLSVIFPARQFDLLPPDMKSTFYWAVIRIALRIGAGVAAFAYADRLLAWLARGLFANQSSNLTPQTTKLTTK